MPKSPGVPGTVFWRLPGFLAGRGAAQRWAEGDAYLEHGAQQCQIYRTVGGLSRHQAIAAVKLGKAGIEEVIQIKMTAEEDAALKKSAAAVQELVDAMKKMA